jgi:sugar phosphate isomerase/epimerase
MSYTFGLQLYSLREATAADHISTIKKLAEMGYKNVEFAGYYGMSGKEMKTLLDDLGMKGISSHVGYHLFADKDAFKREVEFNHAVGNPHIVLPYYSFPDEEAAKASVDKIGAMMEAFKKEGFDFGYHNHAHEFSKFESGKCPMDYIRSIDGIKLQPDVFWVKTAGIDPVEFIKENSGRIISVHMKEYASDGTNIEFGNGILPWKEIMTEAEKAGSSIGIIEQEQYTVEPIDSVKICIDNLNKIFN